VLLVTRDARLEEIGRFNGEYWTNKGENRRGQLLMELGDDLRTSNVEKRMSSLITTGTSCRSLQRHYEELIKSVKSSKLNKIHKVIIIHKIPAQWLYSSSWSLF
jgi:hypothetical protein